MKWPTAGPPAASDCLGSTADQDARFGFSSPVVCNELSATSERASDGHSCLGISGANNRLELGVKVRLIPGHCDPTVNLYDWYVCIRPGRVDQLSPIIARGAVY